MDVNEYQIGGDHYSKRDYQHWDFVCDTKLHYLLGCATKYSRWRDKGGIQDLHKVLHYIAKAKESGIKPPNMESIYGNVSRFIAQFEHGDDRELIILICDGEYDIAQEHISGMIKEYESGPILNKINYDCNCNRG